MSASYHTLTSLTALSLTSKRRRSTPSTPHSLTLARSSLTGFREISTEPRQPQTDAVNLTEAPLLKKQNDVVPQKKKRDDEDEDGDQAISKIPVPRQKYIPVSKAELLDGVVSNLFRDQNGDDLEQFLLLSSCLDSILHAEHKKILEEMRADYSESNSMEYKQAIEELAMANGQGSDSAEGINGVGSEENEAEIPFDYVKGLRKLLGSSAKDVKRRGYATERQKGLLLVEKLEYIQSKLLRGIFFIVSKPLGEIGSWITESLKVALQTPEINYQIGNFQYGWQHRELYLVMKEFYPQLDPVEGS